MIVDSRNLSLLWKIFKRPLDQSPSWHGSIRSLRAGIIIVSSDEDNFYNISSKYATQYYCFLIHLDRATLLDVFQVPVEAIGPIHTWSVDKLFSINTHHPAIKFLFPQNKDDEFEDYVTLLVDDYWIGNFTFEELTEYGEEVNRRILQDGKYLPQKNQLIYTEDGLKNEISNIVDSWFNQLIISEPILVDPMQVPIHLLYRQIAAYFQCEEKECMRIEYSDGTVDEYGIVQDAKVIEMDCRYKRRGSWAHTYVHIRKDGKEAVASVSIDILLGQLAALNLINQNAEIIGV